MFGIKWLYRGDPKPCDHCGRPARVLANPRWLSFEQWCVDCLRGVRVHHVEPAAKVAPTAPPLGDPVLREIFVLWGAFSTLVDHLATPRTEDARTIDPRDLYSRACKMEYPRLVALMYAHSHGDSISEAEEILAEVLLMAADGRRPRFGRELGLVFDRSEAAA